MKRTEQEIKTLVEKALQEKIVSFTLQTGGWSSTTHKVVGESGDIYYFKENSNNHLIQTELTQKLTALGIPLPEIVAIDNDWMLTKSINGVPLKQIKDRSVLLKILPAAGKYAALINSIHIDGYGPLSSINKGTFKSYSEFYKPLLQYIPENHLSLVNSYLNQVNQSFLCHGDMALTHIFVNNNNEFEAIIDIDDVLGAPNYYDLAEFDAGNNRDEQIWNAFTSGYSQVSNAPLHNNQSLLLEEYLITLDSILWRIKNYPNSIELIENEQKFLDKLAQSIWS